jgi:hypothetical protein
MRRDVAAGFRVVVQWQEFVHFIADVVICVSGLILAGEA